MRLQGSEQQRAADIEVVAAKDAGQRADGQRIEIVAVAEALGVKRRLAFQTTVIESAAARAVDFFQRRPLLNHAFGAAHAAAVFAHDENVAAQRQQR
ncbi:MAG: hypothetical protein E6556_05885 [Pantoea sp.]|nr:hypothetical protein [Pantoea sp.]